MGKLPTKKINHNFFKKWSPTMSYILGYVVADGCILVNKNRKDSLTFNITSTDKNHLYRIKKIMSSEHKLSKKFGSSGNPAFQIQVRSNIIARDLISLGVLPRKTYNLKKIRVPDKFLADFIRGFFDGDGSVYVYNVNKTPQIKVNLISTSLPFISDLNKKLSNHLGILPKSIHIALDKRGERIPMYKIALYIDDCKKLYGFMYNKATIYLARKKTIFEKWGKIKRRNYIKNAYPSKIGWYLKQKFVSAINTAHY